MKKLFLFIALIGLFTSCSNKTERCNDQVSSLTSDTTLVSNTKCCQDSTKKYSCNAVVKSTTDSTTSRK